MCRRPLSVICALMLAGAPALPAQATDSSLKIVVLQGGGVTHLVNRNRHEFPVVSVSSKEALPVAGARVTFQLPESGPGGTFGKNRTTLTVTTDKQGRAEGRGFRPNKVLGEYTVRVTATHGALSAETNFKQSNAHSSTAEASRRSGRNMAVVYVLIVSASALMGTLAAVKSRK